MVSRDRSMRSPGRGRGPLPGSRVSPPRSRTWLDPTETPGRQAPGRRRDPSPQSAGDQRARRGILRPADTGDQPALGAIPGPVVAVELAAPPRPRSRFGPKKNLTSAGEEIREAGATRLELATFDSTGRRSNQTELRPRNRPEDSKAPLESQSDQADQRPIRSSARRPRRRATPALLAALSARGGAARCPESRPPGSACGPGPACCARSLPPDTGRCRGPSPRPGRRCARGGPRRRTASAAET